MKIKILPMLKWIEEVMILIVFDHHYELFHLYIDLFFLNIASNVSKVVLIEDDVLMYLEPL